MKPIDSLKIYNDPRHYDLKYRDLVEDIPFWLEQVEKYGEPVLELACGTGRVTIPIAEKGFDITGLDISEPMLEHGKRKAVEKGIKIEWVKADCRDFSLEKKFNLIFFPFSSIAHLHGLESLEALFTCVKEHLTEEGRFIVDHFNPRFDFLTRDPNKRYPVTEYPDPDGKGTVVITETCEYDNVNQINRVKWHYKTGDVDEVVKELNIRVFFPQEFDALLQYNGFKIEAKYGDYDESPFSSSSPKQLAVCRVH